LHDCLPANSISSWNDFIIPLRKHFSNDKTIKLRSEINEFIQFDKEPFRKYMERFKNFLAQSMCQGGFLSKNHTTA